MKSEMGRCPVSGCEGMIMRGERAVKSGNRTARERVRVGCEQSQEDAAASAQMRGYGSGIASERTEYEDEKARRRVAVRREGTMPGVRDYARSARMRGVTCENETG